MLDEFVTRLREMCAKGDAERDKGNVTPDTIERTDDVIYSTNDLEWNKLDLYRPKALIGTKMPVIVSIHGGGWCYGSKEVYQWYCMNLAERGFAVVNFTYRLAPENKFPAVIEDTNNVFEWILKNADEYGLDVDNIFALGDSAGGHYCSLYSAYVTNPELQKNIGFPAPKGLKLKAVALNCGKYSPFTEEGKLDNAMGYAKPEDWSNEEFFKVTDPRVYVTPAYPPAFVMTCSGDFLKTQPESFIRKLEENDVEFEYHRYGTKENVLPHVFHCNIKLSDAKRCNDDECNFFKKFIG